MNHAPAIFLIDKPEGVTSAKAIAQLKEKLQIKKFGHSGTLDPMATGLLVCLTNQATRLAHYAEGGNKVYSGTIAFGFSTDTLDKTGTVNQETKILPSFDELLAVRNSFLGVIQQVPPQISAIKVAGKRAYQRVRDGEKVDLASRKVFLSSFDIHPLHSTERGCSEVRFRIECSKGTYVRSLARDLGLAVGSLGCLMALRREASAPFSVQRAKPLAEIELCDSLCWSELFPKDAILPLDESTIHLLQHGNVSSLQSYARSLASDVTRAIYVHKATHKPHGLLLRKENSWKIGVNLCQAS